MDNLSGQIIKGYELREMIGLGGFAAIYRAYQFVVEREVAIKVILPKHANAPDFIRRFESEAQLIARLEHIHIVPLYDYWREPNNAYLVMRWLRGGSLFELLQQQRIWPLPDIMRLLDQIAAALMVAHRNGVIHQDLTPGNILFDEDRNAYLTDFGIAKRLSQEIQEPGKKPLFGTPTYMSPEQIMRQDVTGQTDIYSLGIILYQLLTGMLPFDAPKVTEILQMQVQEPLPPLQTIRPDLPYTLNVVLLQATSKNPAMRYADAQSLANAFRMAVQQAEELYPSAQERVASRDAPQSPKTAYLTEEMSEAPQTGDFHTVDFGVLLEPQNPYKGLRAFEEADATHFFGREALIQRLLAELAKPTGRFLTVIGPSGSGKSSAVKAGLIPALRRATQIDSEEWFIARMVPGTHPLQELETALGSIAVGEFERIKNLLHQSDQGLLQLVPQILPDEKAELVLVIDQFEEVFTLTEAEAERRRFLDSLVTAVKAPTSRLRVIVTLRADFYDRPLLYPGFGDLVQAHTFVVLPLAPDEMHEVIIGPAERAGLTLEPGLAAAVVADVTEQPGALPLMQYALTELFERRQDHLLTLEAYRSSGGVRGALARRAEELYQSMEPAHQESTRQLFLRLVNVGEGSEDTRRRARWAEFMPGQPEHRPAMQAVLDAYGKYRLLTFDHDPQTREPTVEVAHEALIREWARLREWLDDNRDNLRTQRQLASATAEWIKSGRDASYLATGTRLAQFESLATTSRLVFTGDETAYLQASVAQRIRAARRVQMVITVLIVISVVALTLAAFAFDRQQRAEQAQATSVAERDRADTAARTSRSRELAVTALRNIAQNDFQAQARALLLSLEALKAADTLEARNSLLTALQVNPYLGTFLQVEHNGVRSVAVSADGRLIASGNRDGTITLWDASSGRAIGEPLAGHSDRVNSVAFSPDGRIVASGSSDGTVMLWNVDTHELIGEPLASHEDAVWAVAFSPDGQALVSASSDSTLIKWDADTRDPIGEPLAGHLDEVYTVAFSPDGQQLASAGAEGMIILWDAEPGEMIGQPWQAHNNFIYSVAFSTDGQTLVSGSADNTIRRWNVETREAVGPPLTGHSGWVRSVAFSPDGTQLVSASSDQSVNVWDMVMGRLQSRRTGHTDEVWSAVFAPDGETLVSGSADERIALWNLANPYPLVHRLAGHLDEVASVTFSPDGGLIASSSGAPLGGGNDLSIRLWDAASGEPVGEPMIGHAGLVTSLAFSPDGSRLLSASADGTLRLWDVTSGQPTGQPFTGHLGPVEGADFSPDGQLVASGSHDGTVILWDVTTGQPAADPLVGHEDRVHSVAFSPDGKYLASGSGDGVILIWDVAARQPLEEPLTAHLSGIMALAFSPDGRILASGSRDNTVILWDTANWQPLRPPLTGHTDYVTGVAFSPDGSLLASSSWDSTVILWDITTGRPLGQPLAGHQGYVSAVAFSSDGRILASSSWDRSIGVWDVSLISWQARACAVANRNLTPAEWEQYFADTPYMETCP